MEKLTFFALISCVLGKKLASDGLTPQDFLITDLPLYNGSFDDIPFKQYSGYMPLGDDDETALFFWFVESQSDPKNDPLTLWLNGGPGSSSVAFGFWTEHGPFRLQENAVGVNDYNYSWNQKANVVYVESPSGVGFSYSNKSSGYNCSDEKSAMENYLFLENFLNVFTEYGGNHEILLTGESYGGHYIPQLANYIIEQQPTPKWNVTGFLIGNPGINSDWYYNINEYAFQTYLWSHALLPQTAWVKSNAACDWDQFLTNCSRDFTHPSPQCKAANNEAYPYVPNTWDPYNIYAPTCHQREENAIKNGIKIIRGSEFVKEYTPFLQHLKEKYNLETEYNPCIDNWTPEYMNKEQVLKAIHADSHYTREWPRHPTGWRYGSETEDIALLFPGFFEKRPDWKISVISGDADSAVPFIGSQRWIECLARPVVKDWFNWFMNQDVAGSVKIYKGITFQTIKDCGHTIPTYCPQAGYEFFDQFLSGVYNE